MTKQLTRKKSIQEQIFNEGTINRTAMMYRKHINLRLEKLQQAIDANKQTHVLFIKKELNQLRKNLAELGDVKELRVSMSEMAYMTAPVHVNEIKSRINAMTTKNITKALSLYRGYVDVYLDVLSSAIKQGNTEQVDEVKVTLESLRQNILDLEGVRN